MLHVEQTYSLKARKMLTFLTNITRYAKYNKKKMFKKEC